MKAIFMEEAIYQLKTINTMIKLIGWDRENSTVFMSIFAGLYKYIMLTLYGNIYLHENKHTSKS